MARGKSKKPDELPEVQRGIAMPRKYVDGRAHGGNSAKQVSAWIAFLQGLDVGDSFLIDPWEWCGLAAIAKKLKIDLVHQDDKLHHQYRAWIYGNEKKRTPFYSRIDGREFKLVETTEEER